ncbi:MAG: hypothetical protein IKX54_04445 [Lachnospiraceae bacterium]|nr:hypothetical protein [Lachnospiraceae bacterium]
MRGDGCYTECTVRREKTGRDIVIKVSLIALATLFIILGLLIHPLVLALAAVAWYLVIAFWSRFNVVYEYVFVDGQLDFDKIMGGDARKHLKRIDMDQVILVAPERSHALDSYRNKPEKPSDYTAHSKNEAEHRVYVIVNQGDKGVELIRFEPDDNLLSYMKQKSPRKISAY